MVWRSHLYIVPEQPSMATPVVDPGEASFGTVSVGMPLRYFDFQQKDDENISRRVNTDRYHRNIEDVFICVFIFLLKLPKFSRIFLTPSQTLGPSRFSSSFSVIWLWLPCRMSNCLRLLCGLWMVMVIAYLWHVTTNYGDFNSMTYVTTNSFWVPNDTNEIFPKMNGYGLRWPAPAREPGSRPKAIHVGRALVLGSSSIACCARWNGDRNGAKRRCKVL